MSRKLFHPRLQNQAEKLAEDLQKNLKPNPQNQNDGNTSPIDSEKLANFFSIIDENSRAQIARALTGIETYRAHPYVRNVREPKIVWQIGCSRLLDYGRRGGKPVLFVPSLVNRAYILDLMEDCSLLRWLQNRGLYPYLLDWGHPSVDEMTFGLEEYIARLIVAFDFIETEHHQPIGVAGYCMGGLLALALGLQRQEKISGMAMLATPWDFHQPNASQAKAYANYLQTFNPILENMGYLPTDILQSLFTGLDPLLVLNKFSKFSCYDPDSVKARHFVALEDWLNDGIPLVKKVARDCLVDWYGENKPAKGEWLINGHIVDPKKFKKPVLALMPAGDKIVPLKSAMALVEALTNVEKFSPPLGHIGMVVGRRAREIIWQKLKVFFCAV